MTPERLEEIAGLFGEAHATDAWFIEDAADELIAEVRRLRASEQDLRAQRDDLAQEVERLRADRKR